MILGGITRIVHVAHNLIKAQPSFFECAQNLRFGAETLLGGSHQFEYRSADQHEDGHGDHQLDERESYLAFPCLKARHFSTMVSSVKGRNVVLALRRRAPRMKRFAVGLAPFE